MSMSEDYDYIMRDEDYEKLRGEVRMAEKELSVWHVRGKPWKDKTMYSAKCSDGEWYGLGEKDYGLEDGDLILFTPKYNNKGYASIAGAPLVKRGAGVRQPDDQKPQGGNSAAPTGMGPKPKAGSTYPIATTVSIVRQNANEAAPALLKIALEQGAIKLPTKGAAKLESLLNFYDEIVTDLTKRNVRDQVLMNKEGQTLDAYMGDVSAEPEVDLVAESAQLSPAPEEPTADEADGWENA